VKSGSNRYTFAVIIGKFKTGYHFSGRPISQQVKISIELLTHTGCA